MRQPLAKRVVAEALGTFFLLAAVVGSGIMAERLANGNTALALLANTAATGAALVALIISFGSMSGAHFNPVVTLAFAFRHDLFWRDVPLYLLAQFVGGIGGVIAANLMFGLPAVFASNHPRNGDGPTIQRVHCDTRIVKCDSGNQPLNHCRCRGCRWSLHKRSILVYGFNVLC